MKSSLRRDAARELRKYARLYSDNRPLEVGSRVEIGDIHLLGD